MRRGRSGDLPAGVLRGQFRHVRACVDGLRSRSSELVLPGLREIGRGEDRRWPGRRRTVESPIPGRVRARHMEIRIGLPLTGGALVREAKAHRLPVLFSANAFVRRNTERDQVSFRLPKTGAYRGLDAALDSAGFVAMAKYNGYEWTVEQYMKLAAAQDWTWYAQMDCCCEPEVAGDDAERRLRLAE